MSGGTGRDGGGETLRIANCSGFYGDRLEAAREMVEGGPIDVLTGDYLAELTMLILYKARLGDQEGGYARTFVRQMGEVLGTCVARGIKVVANAGGLNPAGLAAKLRELAASLGVEARVAHVAGDDVTATVARRQAAGDPFCHLDTGRPLAAAGSEPVTANAYLGGSGIAAALAGGADVVVTGRVTDAALVVGPALWRFGWPGDAWDRLAGAVVAGHVIECGPQATGGNYSFFTEVPGLEHPGFPICELADDGSSVITKHPGTGGRVDTGTVTAQLLYEIGGPSYANPDVVADFSSITLTEVGPDRVRISGVRGSPPPGALKVSVNLVGGWRNSATFVLTGLDIDAKADLVRRSVDDALGRLGDKAVPDSVEWRLIRTDRDDAPTNEQAQALLRLDVKDPVADTVGRPLTGTLVELALASYPGLYLTSPPQAASAYGVFWPTLIPTDEVTQVVVHHDGRAEEVPVHLGPTPGTTGTTGTPGAAGTTGAAEGGDAARADEGGAEVPDGPTTAHRRVPLGTIVGARSGDKGGNANVGLWARSDDAWRWLRATLTVARLRELLVEARHLEIDRYELPNLRAVNFVVHGLLGEGVASSTRPDPQAKSLGEYLRSRLVDIPVALLDGQS